MARLLQCRWALLESFKDELPHWYEIMCYFKFHIYLNLLVDVPQELNIKFHYDMVESQLFVQPSILLFQFNHVIL